MPPAKKKPADRQPPKGALFTFEAADGKTFSLPLASKGAGLMSGRVLRDAVMDSDDLGELKLGYAMLDACGAPVDVINAVYDLPNDACLKVIKGWLTHGDGKGTPVPQSSGSST